MLSLVLESSNPGGPILTHGPVPGAQLELIALPKHERNRRLPGNLTLPVSSLLSMALEAGPSAMGTGGRCDPKNTVARRQASDRGVLHACMRICQPVKVVGGIVTWHQVLALPPNKGSF